MAVLFITMYIVSSNCMPSVLHRYLS